MGVPLRHLDYQVEIHNSLARVVLEQVYTNPTEKYLELEYCAPIQPKVCVYKFKAVFGEMEIEGVVKEKEEAKYEYEQAVKEGKKAAFGQIDENSKDVLRLKVGNVPPKESVTIRI